LQILNNASRPGPGGYGDFSVVVCAGGGVCVVTINAETAEAAEAGWLCVFGDFCVECRGVCAAIAVVNMTAPIAIAALAAREPMRRIITRMHPDVEARGTLRKNVSLRPSVFAF
jgi:hypothetical protein